MSRLFQHARRSGLRWRLAAVTLLVWQGLADDGRGCDLCAIYGAESARDQRDSGLSFTLSESHIANGTTQYLGREVAGRDFRDASVTHLVPSYSFTRFFGVSLNVPYVHQAFQRAELRYRLDGPPVARTERASVMGFGDLSLIGRATLFERRRMKYGVSVTVLAGVKFPTGDTERIADEVQQTRIYDQLLPPGTPHDPLGHSISGVHQHDLSPGSGSFDGIFGLTTTARWRRWFANAQFQYYLRTPGESGYEKGDEIMVSGGPGLFLWSGREATLSIQANAGYDSMARDVEAGRLSNYTGLTAWYLGPQLAATLGERLSVVAGVDVPLHVTSNGLQVVPDRRIHASLAWRF